LCRFAGINAFVHWTFTILRAWIFVGPHGTGQDLAAALRGVSFIPALFVCIVLLESLRPGDFAAARVLRDGQLIGLMTIGNITEVVMANAALEGGGNSAVA
jgi:hypothetical protein